MSACEFCEEPVPEGGAHRLAPEDVAWMADALVGKHRKRYGVDLDYAAVERSDIVERLEKFRFCSADCALAAGAESALGSGI